LTAHAATESAGTVKDPEHFHAIPVTEAIRIVLHVTAPAGNSATAVPTANVLSAAAKRILPVTSAAEPAAQNAISARARVLKSVTAVTAPESARAVTAKAM
jgi:hypothetical protein